MTVEKETNHAFARSLTGAGLDTTPLNFGMYKGKTPYEVATYDPGYIQWMYDNIKSKKCSKELRDACEYDEREEISECCLDDDWGDRS